MASEFKNKTLQALSQPAYDSDGQSESILVLMDGQPDHEFEVRHGQPGGKVPSPTLLSVSFPCLRRRKEG